MSFEPEARSFEAAQSHLAYLRRRVREEVQAEVRAGPVAATLPHGSAASAYATRCSNEDGQAWVAQNRLW